MQVEIDSIRVRKRVRKEKQDIEQLAYSMSRFGLLHPVAITRHNTLIAGYRRLEAARFLGWSTIEATIISHDSPADRLELELDENLQRVPLKHEELESAIEKLENIRHPGFFRRIWNAVAGFFMRLFGIEV